MPEYECHWFANMVMEMGIHVLASLREGNAVSWLYASPFFVGSLVMKSGVSNTTLCTITSKRVQQTNRSRKDLLHLLLEQSGTLFHGILIKHPQQSQQSESCCHSKKEMTTERLRRIRERMLLAEKKQTASEQCAEEPSAVGTDPTTNTIETRMLQANDMVCAATNHVHDIGDNISRGSHQRSHQPRDADKRS